MLHAPEASRGDGAFLRRVGDVGRAAFGGAEAHFRGAGEGPEEAGEEGGHEAGHYYGEDGEEEGLRGELQGVGGSGIRLGGLEEGVCYFTLLIHLEDV